MALAAALPLRRASSSTGGGDAGRRVLGSGLAGAPEDQVPDRARRAVAATLAEPVGLRADGRVVWVKPAQLFTLDRAATTEAVMDAGRTGFVDRARRSSRR